MLEEKKRKLELLPLGRLRDDRLLFWVVKPETGRGDCEQYCGWFCACFIEEVDRDDVWGVVVL